MSKKISSSCEKITGSRPGNIGDSDNPNMDGKNAPWKMKDLIAMVGQQTQRLSTFDGTTGAERFLDEINFHKEKWGDERLLEAIKISLKGEAYLWFCAHYGYSIKTIGEFTPMFRRRFFPRDSPGEATLGYYKKLLGVPRQMELTKKYIYEIAKLGQDARAPVETAISELKQYLPLSAHENYEKTISSWGDFLEFWEERINEGGKERKELPQHRERKSIPNLCRICKKERHWGWKCPLKKDKERKNTKVKHHENYTCSVRNKDLICLESVKFTKSTVDALIDTGATSNFMSFEFAKALGLSIRPQNDDVSIAVGYTTLVGDATAEFEIQNCAFKETFSIIRGLSKNVILGSSFLNRISATINYRRGQIALTFTNRTGKKKREMNLITDSARKDEEGRESQKNAPLEIIKILDKYEKAYAEADHKWLDQYQHEIKIGDKQPRIRKMNYRLREDKKEFVRMKTLELLEKGVIEESTSRWNFPIVCAKKGDSFRLCIDYRSLNEVTDKETVPPPQMDEVFDSLHGMMWFSKIDLKDGYHQITLSKISRPYTAFTTQLGRFQFRKMPFGLVNAPATFQEIMYAALQKFIGKFCYAYMDDIIVFSKTKEEHMDHLEQILVTLASRKLQINPDKCRFMENEIDFLGFKILNGKVVPGEQNILTLKKHIHIKSHKDLRAALGVIGYHRKFVKNYASRTRCLHAAASGRADIPSNAEEIVNEVKNEIINSEGLFVPDFTKKFIIETDASDQAVAAVLKQEFADGEHIIRYASRVLKGAETRYSTTEKELLGVVFAVTQFRIYLFKKFTIRTDHKPLIWIGRVKNPQGRIARWIMTLSNFDFNIEHIDGTRNNWADFLSRTSELNIVEDKCFPTEQDLKAVEDAHVATGHAGRDATYMYLKERHSFPKAYETVNNFVRNCQTCSQFRKQKQFIVDTTGKRKPFEKLGIDLIGPLTRTGRGNRYIVMATDYATKYATAKPIREKSAAEIANFLVDDIFLRHGVPKEIITDQGKEFRNRLIVLLCKYWQSKLNFSTAYHPQANGLAERTNQSLILRLSKMIGPSIDRWDTKVNACIFSYNITPIEATKISPFELTYGFKPNFPPWKDDWINEEVVFEEDLVDWLEKRVAKQELNEELIEKAQDKYIEKIGKLNKDKAPKDDLKYGDSVLLRRREKGTKLESPWTGPFIVQGHLGKGIYKIRAIERDLLLTVPRKDLLRSEEKVDSNIVPVLQNKEIRQDFQNKPSKDKINLGRMLPSRQPMIIIRSPASVT